MKKIASKLVLLDGQLKRYGPEAERARELQRAAVAPMIDRIWGDRAATSTAGAPYGSSVEGDLVYEAIEALKPQNELQHNLKFRALMTTAAITGMMQISPASLRDALGELGP